MNKVFEILKIVGIKDFIIQESFWFLLSSIFIFVSVMIDLATGVSKAKALKERVYSGGFRKSVTKLKEYLYLMYFGTVVDVALFAAYKQIPVGVLFACLACCLTELISVIENLKNKKSAAAQVPEMLEKIINCNTKEKALELIDELKDGQTTN